MKNKNQKSTEKQNIAPGKVGANTDRDEETRLNKSAIQEGPKGGKPKQER